MKTACDCVPCLIRQALEASRYFTDDAQFQEKIIKDILKNLADEDLTSSPPAIARHVHRRIKEMTGLEDPYREVKKGFNALALKMLDPLREEIMADEAPLLAAVKLAIAGNVIDSGAKTSLTEKEVPDDIEAALSQPLEGDVSFLFDALEKAERILYLADNAGEIVFDRPLIELIGPERVIMAVRGAPVINDATLKEARETGLDSLVRVIDNGSDAPGTLLDDCSSSFLDYFNGADLIIAKGQGNYESLCDVSAPLHFLFKVKCPVIAERSGFAAGSHVVKSS